VNNESVRISIAFRTTDTNEYTFSTTATINNNGCCATNDAATAAIDDVATRLDAINDKFGHAGARFSFKLIFTFIEKS
jgi:hypothetical protein